MFREGEKAVVFILSIFIDAMKSRPFIHLCFSLLLLFAQQFAFAGALDHVQQTVFDHQCSVEEGDAADGELSKHLLIDEYDDAPPSVFVIPPAPSLAAQSVAVACDQFFRIASPHYFSRAPPLA